jgi:hypothetical protein
LFEEVAETVTFALAWRAEMFVTIDDEDAVGTAVAGGAAIGDTTFIANRNSQHVHIITVRKTDLSVGCRETNDGHRRTLGEVLR